MKRKVLALIVIVFNFLIINNSKAQEDYQLKFKIENSLYSFFNTYGHDVFSNPKYKDKAYTFGFAISINQHGLVEEVIFSNKTKTLDSLVSFAEITKKLKAQKTAFKSYRNTVLISFVLVRRGWDKNIANFYDKDDLERNPELPDFDTYFYKIMPNIDRINKDKKIKFLQPFSMIQVQGHR
ncbi:hypothetical protein ACHMWN_00245 [Pedobacter sp. UC225_61]|uniref:hypothetical protein n=1 Tax=Pedobacter sp. UC225_61 TaxID=3374623 RepID=UPI0037964067